MIFRSLNKDDIEKIVSLELDKVSERLKDHNLTLAASPAALSALAEQGYDADFGARPLRRIIQQKVEDPLSDRLLSGEFVDGDMIDVDVTPDGEVELKRAPWRSPSRACEPKLLRSQAAFPVLEPSPGTQMPGEVLAGLIDSVILA